jgi:hypothetical protein
LNVALSHRKRAPSSKVKRKGAFKLVDNDEREEQFESEESANDESSSEEGDEDEVHMGLKMIE